MFLQPYSLVSLTMPPEMSPDTV